MFRTFARVTTDELRVKISEAAAPFVPVSGSGDPDLTGEILALLWESYFKEDFDVEVSFENLDCESGYNGCDAIAGLRQLSNGLSFVGCSGGGDWEVPIFFIIYWDGQRLRAYVPTDGNVWNLSTRAAYGNDAKSDYEDARRRYPGLVHIFDDMEEHSRASCRKFGISDDLLDFDISEIPECSTDEIIADIERHFIMGTSEPVEIPTCDGLRLSRVGDFIVLQPTVQGSVRGRGLMLPLTMAAQVAQDILKFL